MSLSSLFGFSQLSPSSPPSSSTPTQEKSPSPTTAATQQEPSPSATVHVVDEATSEQEQFFKTLYSETTTIPQLLRLIERAHKMTTADSTSDTEALPNNMAAMLDVALMLHSKGAYYDTKAEQEECMTIVKEWSVEAAQNNMGPLSAVAFDKRVELLRVVNNTPVGPRKNAKKKKNELNTNTRRRSASTNTYSKDEYFSSWSMQKGSPLRTMSFVLIGIFVVFAIWERWEQQHATLHSTRTALSNLQRHVAQMDDADHDDSYEYYKTANARTTSNPSGSSGPHSSEKTVKTTESPSRTSRDANKVPEQAPPPQEALPDIIKGDGNANNGGSSPNQNGTLPTTTTTTASDKTPPPSDNFNSLKYWSTERFANTVPAGYGAETCTKKPQEHDWAGNYTFGFVASSKDGGVNNNDKCLTIPRSSPRRLDRLRRDIFAQMNLTHDELTNTSLWPAEYKAEGGDPSSISPRRSRHWFRKFKGVRLLAILGRDDFMDITARAIRRMLVPNGGIVCHVTIMCFWNQNQTVQKMVLEEMKIPSELVSFQFWSPDVPFWDFTRLYKDIRDGYLHIKLDDDMYFVSHDFDTLLAHTYLFPEEHSSPSAKSPEKCDIVSANVVNHHWLTSIHQQMGSINFLIDRPLKLGYHVKHSDYGFPAIWGLIHRSFLRTMRNGAGGGGAISDTEDTRNLIEKFDFGLHDFNCDGRARRWSINSFIFGWSASEASHIHANDEEFITKLTPYGHSGRGRACAVGEAIGVHSMFQHQAAWHSGQSTKDLDAAKRRLRTMYEAISLHMDGVKPCCKSTSCPLFAEAVPPSSKGNSPVNKREQLSCEDKSTNATSATSDTEKNPVNYYEEMLQCAFPFTSATSRSSMKQFINFVPIPKKKKGRK